MEDTKRMQEQDMTEEQVQAQARGLENQLLNSEIDSALSELDAMSADLENLAIEKSKDEDPLNAESDSNLKPTPSNPLEFAGFMADQTLNAAAAVGAGVIEAVPGGQHALAGAETLVEKAYSSAIGEENSLSELYKQNHQEWGDALTLATKGHPTLAKGGEFLSYMTMLKTPTLSSSLKFGAAHQVGKLNPDDLDPSSILEAAAQGVAVSGAGYGAGKAIGAGVSATANYFSKLFEKAGNSAIIDSISLAQKSIRTNINKHIRKWYGKGEADITNTEMTAKFANELMDTTIHGKPLLKVGQSLDDTLVNSKEAVEYYGEKIGDLIKDSDDFVPKTNAKDLFDELLKNSKLAIQEGSDHKKTADAAKKAIAELTSGFKKKVPTFKTITKEVPSNIIDPQTGKPIINKVSETVEDYTEEWADVSLSRLHTFKVALAQDIKTAFENKNVSVSKKALSELVGKMSSYIDDAIGKHSTNSSLKDLNRKYANMLLLKESTEELLNSQKGGVMEGFRALLNTRAYIAGGIATASGVPAPVAMGVAAGLSRVMNDPRTPLAFGAGLKKLSDHLLTNPDSMILKQILTSAAISSESFNNTVAMGVADIHLKDQPVGRNVDSFLKNKGSLLAIADYYAPEVAKSLRANLKDKDRLDADKLDPLIEQLADNPATKKYFESGMGVNGKVYSMENKLQLIQQIKENRKISGRDRIMLMKQVKEHGIIPDYSKVPQRKPRQFKQTAPTTQSKY